MALSGDQAVVGAPERATAGVSYSGAVYAFGRSGSTWAQQTRIDPPTPATMMHFGFAVAVDGATVLAGEPVTNNNYTGHAYAYLLTSGRGHDPAGDHAAGLTGRLDQQAGHRDARGLGRLLRGHA